MTGYRDDPRLDRAVYQPAEDSELLAQAAVDQVGDGLLVIETGVGSGFVAEHLREVRDVTVVGSDVNPHACVAARERGLPVVRGSLLSFLVGDSVDVGLFNPPYLPEAPGLPDDWLERAVTGGPSGAEVLLAWLDDLPRVLRPGGFGLALLSSITGRERVEAHASRAGLAVEAVASQRLPHERLWVLRVEPVTR
ncbi:MAG: HemK2/MTQ2 family protein methyltransferase [Halobacteriales archaeon]